MHCRPRITTKSMQRSTACRVLSNLNPRVILQTTSAYRSTSVEIDSFIQPLQANDKLLLCSDGLWDMVRDPEIQRVVSSSIPTPTELGKNLVQAALDGGGEDNVSVIVVSITDTGGHTGMTGINLHYKPDSVTLPGCMIISMRWLLFTSTLIAERRSFLNPAFSTSTVYSP